MQTLLEQFLGRQHTLDTRLRQATSAHQVLAVLTEELDRLQSIEGEYIRSLTVPNARRARQLLRLLRTSLLSLSAISTPSYQAVGTVEQTGWLARGLTFIARGVAFLSRWAGGSCRVSEGPLGATIAIDAPTVLQCLRQALEIIDQQVTPSDVSPPSASQGEDCYELFRFLQRVLGDINCTAPAERPEFHHRLYDDVVGALLLYGIELKYFAANDFPSLAAAKGIFDFLPGHEARTDYVTSLPALVKGDSTVVRGLVFVPPQSQNNAP